MQGAGELTLWKRDGVDVVRQLQLHGMMRRRYCLWLWCTAVMMSTCVGGGYGAQSCNALLSSNKGFTHCQTLPKLGSTLAWTIHNATNAVDIAFSGAASSSGGWVGWGVNPTARAMVGTQALVAFKSARGVAVVHTYAITGAMKSGAAPFVPGNLALNFTKASAEITAATDTDTEMTIFVTLNVNVRANQSASPWIMNHAWNQGSSVDLATNAVGPHAMAGDSVASVATIDYATNVVFQGIDLPHQKLKNRHGIISAVAWGLLLPVGAMAARYLRPLSGGNPAWFYLHVACQCTGYLLGVVAWAMGLQLHAYVIDAGAAVPTKHRGVGISIFTLASLQMLALWMRPKPDAKYRKYWNVYHHAVGYSTVVLSIVNVFEGLALLRPGDKWTNAYIVVLTVLGGTSFFLEIIIWTAWLRHRAKQNAGTTLPSRSKDGTAAAAVRTLRCRSHEQERQQPIDTI